MPDTVISPLITAAKAIPNAKVRCYKNKDNMVTIKVKVKLDLNQIAALGDLITLQT